MTPRIANRIRPPMIALFGLLFLAPGTVAVPPGTLFITDVAGDQALLTESVPLVAWDDHLDFLSLWIDSTGTTLTFTMNVTDLRLDQPMSAYSLDFALGGARLGVRCRIGDSGSGAFAPECLASGFTSVAGLIEVATSTAVPSTVDYTANYWSASVPYAALGLASGDSLGSFRVSTCEARVVVLAWCGVDSATTASTYTLA